jgi:hypothetical protein
MEHQYDPALDRLDVGLLAVWHLAEAGHWDWLEELGVRKDVLLPPYLQLVTEHERPRHADGKQAEKAILRLVVLCPLVLDGALEAVRRYQALTGWERVAFYARLKGLAS